jgi:four helix bundle protein
MQDFRKLLVWQRANEFGRQIDGIVRRWPRHGSASAKTELSRSADSIGTNIAEGCGAATQREFARHLDIAIKSTSETEHHVESAGKRGMIPESAREMQVDELSQIRRMLYGLRKRVLSQRPPQEP